MKKVLALVLVCVVCVTGTALARTKDSQPRRNPPARMEQQIPGHDAPKPAPRAGSRIFTPDMPKEIREKAAELAKLRIDLEEAMTSRPLNREKALEVHAKMLTLKQEIETWRFSQRLDRIEERQKKGLSPAPEEVSPSAEEETDETPAETAETPEK